MGIQAHLFAQSLSGCLNGALYFLLSVKKNAKGVAAACILMKAAIILVTLSHSSFTFLGKETERKGPAPPRLLQQGSLTIQMNVPVNVTEDLQHPFRDMKKAQQVLFLS